MKKKELGLGIRALLANAESHDPATQEKVVKELSSTVAEVPLKYIEQNPFQPRKEFNQEDLNELTESIKIHGLIQPITLRRLNEQSFQIISGERRWRAAKDAGMKSIPAYIRVANDQAMLEMALIENIQRQDLNAMEIAISFNRLLSECQLTHEGLSERVSKKRSTVTNYLRLLKLPPEVQQAAKEDKITMGHARALAGIKNVDIQLKALKAILKKGLSVRAAEDLVRKMTMDTPRPQREEASSKIPGNQVQMLEDKMLQKFGAQVKIKEKPTGDGQILISFDDRDHLNDLLEFFEII